MKKVLLVLLVLVVIGVFAAGYFLGNIPVISDLLGTSEHRDLGVELSVDSAYEGLSAMNQPVTVEELEVIANDPQSFKSVQTSLTEEEASSLLALGHIPNFPFRLIQLDFGPGGTVKSSGVLDIPALQMMLKDMGISNDVVDKIMSYIKAGKYVNYYFEGRCSIENNVLSLETDKLELGKIPVPDDILQNELSVNRYDITSEVTAQGYNIRKLSITEGQVELDMDRPLSSLTPWLHFVRGE